MSKINVFNEAWTDLVFEGRNKDYGAYQLRREDGATTAKSLFLGIGLLAALVSIPVINNYFTDKGGIVISSPAPELPESTVVKVDLPLPPQKPQPVQKQETGIQASSKRQVQFATPVITSRPVTAVIPTTTDFDNADPGSHTDPGDGNGNIAIGANGSSSGTATSGTGTATEGPEGTVPLAGLDKAPGFPGGMDKFYQQVSSKFRIPEADNAAVIKVYVYFVIEKDGSMSGVRVTRKTDPAMEKEAIRVLNSIKAKWTPGIKNGNPVRTAYFLPVTINVH